MTGPASNFTGSGSRELEQFWGCVGAAVSIGDRVPAEVVLRTWRFNDVQVPWRALSLRLPQSKVRKTGRTIETFRVSRGTSWRGQMDEEMRRTILALVDQHRIMTIATLRSDGWPQATTVGYANEGLTL